MNARMESIGAQYLPDYGYAGWTDRNEFGANDFLFNQLECDDNLEEDYNIYDQPQIVMTNYDNFMTDNNNEYMFFNQELEKYTKEMDEQNNIFEKQNEEAENATKMLNYLISIEAMYTPDWDYIERIQPDISQMMRAILFDWMMEVWNEFTLKRETFYYSANYVDRFLSIHQTIKKEELQLVGVTSMFIAAKMEEVYSPRVADFAKSTDNGYNANQIIKMEKIILRELGWRTTPPTYAMWANWYMNQWDIYITTNEYALNHQIIKIHPELTFKSSNEISYARFREVMQILDLIILDYNSLQYKPRGLIASILYLIIGIHVDEFTIAMIWQNFTFSSNAFLNEDIEYNILFTDFLELSFGFQIHELAPTIQFVSSFMGIPFNYDLPISAQNKNILEGNFEEFLSYQTHHPLALEYTKWRIMNGGQF